MQKEVKESKNRLRTPRISRKNIKQRGRSKSAKRLTNKRKQINSNVHLYTTDYINCISSLKVHQYLGIGIFENNNDVIKMISDIYPLIKNKENAITEEENLNEDISPLEFLHWILCRYEDTKEPGDQWSVIYNNDKNKFEICYYYDYVDIGEHGRSQSLEFLLKVKNKDLYELFLGFLHLMNKAIELPYWFNSSDYDYHLEYFQYNYEEYKDSEDEDEQEIAANYWETLAKYEVGSAKQLELAIIAKTTTKKLFLKELKEFKPKGKKEKMIINFINKHLHLTKKGKHSLHCFYHPDSEGENSPVAFDQYASLIFSYANDDDFHRHTNEICQMNYNEYGILPFRHIAIEGEGGKEPELPRLYVKMLDDLGKIVEEYTEGT